MSQNNPIDVTQNLSNIGQSHPTPPPTSIAHHHPPSQRILTTSNSFDSKSNLPNYATNYQMSTEASRLFNTLQQSPLPLTSNEVS